MKPLSEADTREIKECKCGAQVMTWTIDGKELKLYHYKSYPEVCR